LLLLFLLVLVLFFVLVPGVFFILDRFQLEVAFLGFLALVLRRIRVVFRLVGLVEVGFSCHLAPVVLRLDCLRG
jgi:hypothetical protein